MGTTSSITTGYSYTPTGQRETETKGNENVVTYHYNDDGTLDSLTEATGGASPTSVAEHYFSYDLNNNITKDNFTLRKADGTNASHPYSLEYTPNNQVKSVSYADTVKTTPDEKYTYDSSGKLIEQVTPVAGNPNPIVADFIYLHSRLDRVVYSGGSPAPGSYAYDALGRLTNVTNGYVFGGASSASQRYNYDGFDNVTLQYQDTGSSTAFTTTTYDSLNRAQDVFNVSTSQTTTPEYLGASATVITDHIKVGTSPTDGDTKTYAYAPDGERLAMNDQVASPAANETDYYSYNEHGDVEALTQTDGLTRASYGYTAYGANDTTLDSGPDFATNPAPTFIFNSYRFRAGRLDPITSNLDLGVGTYNPNMNGFISRSALAVAPSVQNTPMSLGELLLGLDTIQQGFHTVFQTNASLGDKVWAGGWAALAIAGDVAMVADGAGLLVKGAAWAVDAAKVARLAKDADAAITAASDADKLITATVATEELGGSQGAVMYAKGSGAGGGIDDVGESYLQKIRDLGVNVLYGDPDNPDVDKLLDFTRARGATAFDGSSPAETFVSLHSQRATNSTVYEEYLHVVEGEKRGWVSLPYPSAEYNLEEIAVEARVLEKANDLHMTPDLIDELTKVRQGYIDNLEQQFGIVYQPGS